MASVTRTAPRFRSRSTGTDRRPSAARRQAVWRRQTPAAADWQTRSRRSAATRGSQRLLSCQPQRRGGRGPEGSVQAGSRARCLRSAVCPATTTRAHRAPPAPRPLPQRRPSATTPGREKAGNFRRSPPPHPPWRCAASRNSGPVLSVVRQHFVAVSHSTR
jgi:hypothetical protein